MRCEICKRHVTHEFIKMVPRVHGYGSVGLVVMTGDGTDSQAFGQVCASCMSVVTRAFKSAVARRLDKYADENTEALADTNESYAVNDPSDQDQFAEVEQTKTSPQDDTLTTSDDNQQPSGETTTSHLQVGSANADIDDSWACTSNFDAPIPDRANQLKNREKRIRAN